MPDTIRRNEHTKDAGLCPAEKKKKRKKRDKKRKRPRGLASGEKKNIMIYIAKPLFFLGD